MNKNLWPNDHQLSFIVVSGDFGAGKTLWGLSIDPVLKGKGIGRTLHCDMENSAEAYENNYEFDRLDMPRLARTQYGDDWNYGQLYQLWWKLVEDMTKQKDYSVLIIDDFSPLQEGAFAVAKGNDNMQKWMNVKTEFRQHLKLLQTRVDTIVVVVHLRNKRDGKEKELKGIDVLTELSQLTLYLHRDPNKMIRINGQEYKSCPNYPYPSGIVLKSRLEIMSEEKDEYGDYKHQPLLPSRIPTCTPGSIRRYLAKPSVKFTEDEQMPEEIPGMKEETSEEERGAARMAELAEKLKIEENEGRTSLIKALLEDSTYEREGQILKAAKALGITYSLANHQSIYNQLSEYAKNKE